MKIRSLLRWAMWCLAAAGLLAVLVTFALGWALRASLPQLDGRRYLPGLSAPVTVTRDALGVPDILATNRLDGARALGFIHAQERFFQMDLLRRRGAGELAALFGPALVDHDIQARRHGFRKRARASLDRAAESQRANLDAYVAGVNAGLVALGARPPEYLLLRADPDPWRAEDSLLVAFAMYFALQDSTGSEDLRREAVLQGLPTAAVKFFFPESSEWEAALDDSILPAPQIPGPEVIDFSADKPGALLNGGRRNSESGASRVPGSNSWGVDGASSLSGAAILANDMHLDLGVPNIWFRICMRWHRADGGIHRTVGVTLPGVPSLVVGSNGDVAWTFTNATLDTTDLVVLELDPAMPSRYRTPDGWREFESVTESIEVRGEARREIRIEQTLWGPRIDGTVSGRAYALCWIAHRPGAVNLDLLDMEEVRTVSEALTLAPRCGVPVQNLVVGDRAGQLAWTLMGPIPHRVGADFDGREPISWADGSHAWNGNGATNAGSRPRIVGAPGARFWTANNRVAGTPEYFALGPWSTDPGARARQIRDDLNAIPGRTDETAMMNIHRDDRALFLSRWQALLLRVITGPLASAGTNASRWSQMRRHVEHWEGRASTNSVGYRLVRGFRFQTLERVMEPVVARCQQASSRVYVRESREEFPVWTLLESRPSHLLNPRFAGYDELLADAVNAVLADLDRQGVALDQATWGARNLLRMQHPTSLAVPQLSRWLDFPVVPLPGDDHMPRVQGRSFGASQRMVVSPGHEEQGLFHMPGGQSGHFLSPFYRSGHHAWVNVEPTPLLPGVAVHTLTLTPARRR